MITRKRLVGYIQGNEVWKVLGTEVLPFPKATLHLTEEQVILFTFTPRSAPVSALGMLSHGIV